MIKLSCLVSETLSAGYSILWYVLTFESFLMVNMLSYKWQNLRPQWCIGLDSFEEWLPFLQPIMTASAAVFLFPVTMMASEALSLRKGLGGRLLSVFVFHMAPGYQLLGRSPFYPTAGQSLWFWKYGGLPRANTQNNFSHTSAARLEPAIRTLVTWIHFSFSSSNTIPSITVPCPI